VDTIFGLQVVGSVKRPIKIDCVMANSMEAYTLASRRWICHHRHNVRIVMEQLDLSFARLIVLLVSSIDPAMDVNGSDLGEPLAEIFDIATE
jgi:hypothetical protein